jgi:hypothetical protein
MQFFRVFEHQSKGQTIINGGIVNDKESERKKLHPTSSKINFL